MDITNMDFRFVLRNGEKVLQYHFASFGGKKLWKDIEIVENENDNKNETYTDQKWLERANHQKFAKITINHYGEDDK